MTNLYRQRYSSYEALPALAIILFSAVFVTSLHADGKVFAPRTYKGSLEERSQEAIIIFTNDPSEERSGFEHVILKITVEGGVDNFAWVVPFPNEPKVEKEDGKLFAELFNYVQARSPRWSAPGAKSEVKSEKKSEDVRPVEVLSRKTVGSYDVAVVRENQAGALNRWLETEDYQPIVGGEDVIEFYRKKGYVFACIKVADTALAEKKSAELHPLRFSFSTGGYDGIYYPMKLTGLQKQNFLVNLYVFYGAWLNDHRNDYGFERRGFHLVFRDWDEPDCEPNAGKRWADPNSDPYLRPYVHSLPTTTKLFAKLHPDRKFYLTNVQGRFAPADVRNWKDDLWLYPYYVDKSMVPYDARTGSASEDDSSADQLEFAAPKPVVYADLRVGLLNVANNLWWEHPALVGAAIFIVGSAFGIVGMVFLRRIRRTPAE